MEKKKKEKKKKEKKKQDRSYERALYKDSTNDIIRIQNTLI